MLVVIIWMLVAIMVCIIGNILDVPLLIGAGTIMLVLTTAVYSFAF
jgi:hypothetical protein